MNPERPTDPREQMEVRITALLLGEASAFEEAELLEAIKRDPALAAYYEEMRQMVRRVEETIQLAPLESTTKQLKLSVQRRDALDTLFNQPPAKTVRLVSPGDRARRLTWLQQVAAIAAAFMILAVVAGMFLSVGGRLKNKAMRISQLSPERESLSLAPSPGAPTATNSFALGLSSSTTPLPELQQDREVEVELDERFLARYGNSQGATQSKRAAKMTAAQFAEQPPGPAKPADIYLPSTSTDTAGVPVQRYAGGAERGAVADHTVRDYYFRDNRVDAAKDSAPREEAAVAMNAPILAFSAPDVSTAPASPAPVPALEAPADQPGLVRESIARSPDAAPESGVVLGKKLALLAPTPPVKSETAEPRPGRSMGPSIPVSNDEMRRRELVALGLAESKFNDVAETALPAGGVRGRAVGDVSRAQTDGLAALESVAGQQLDRNAESARSADVGRGVGVSAREWREGRPRSAAAGLAGGGTVIAGEPVAPGGPAIAPTDAGQSLGFFDAPGKGAPVAALASQAHAANTWHAGFGVVAAQSEAESTGRGAVAEDFATNGQVTTDLFAKQPADTKSDERLDRLGEETSLGLAVNEAKVPAEPMYQERLLTEQRQLDRERVKELSDPLAISDESASLAEIELRRKFVEPEWLGVLEQPQPYGDRGVSGVPDRQELQIREFDLDSDKFYRAFQATLANPDGIPGDGSEPRVDAPSFHGSAFAQASISPTGNGQGGGGGGGIRFLATTNDMSIVNAAVISYLESVGVSLTPPKTLFYNDRTGRLMVRAEADELALIEKAVEILDYSSAANQGIGTTQSRFDTLADRSNAEFTVAGDNERERPLTQQVESAPLVAPQVTQLAEEVVEAQPATPPPPSLEPLPEISTKDNAFSTFSLNVNDVSFQLAASSLENGQMPDGARLRSEEFINAFDYRDPMPAPGQRVAFNWERARNPFAHNRELLRFSVQTAAAGREPGQPLNLVLLLDNSGSMERADRVQITEQMLRVLAAQLTEYDRVSFISFARTPRLIVDGATGGHPDALLKKVIGLNPDGGTNLEDALKLGYETAAKHFQANGNNRVILITDGAANLGNVDPAQLRERVIEQRKRGIALDCFGVGWEGYNDNLLESLSRNGDGRYGFLNDAVNAPAQFASQLAGALQVAAADVKAQIEFNPNRVTVYRQIGYQQHQLTKEQFRDNTVDAAELGAAEAGNALYSVEINPNGSGPIGTFRARYRVPSTGAYEEKEWVLDYTPGTVELERAASAMRLASASAAFAEWLANSPYAQSVTPDALQNLLRDVPETFAPDPRPANLQAMIQQARAISGR